MVSRFWKRRAAQHFVPLGLQTFEGFGDIDDKAIVFAAPDFFKGILHRRFHGDRPALDADHGDVDLHRIALNRRAHMIHGDMSADRVLALVQMIHQKTLTGVFDILDHVGGGINPALIAHETNGAVPVDFDFLRLCETGFQCVLHVTLPLYRALPRSQYFTRRGVSTTIVRGANNSGRRGLADVANPGMSHL